jgi:hypothetical protein
MHWLLVLALLSSTTDIKDQNASGSNLNRLAENALRQKLGSSVKNLRVDLRKGKNRGDFDMFNVTLDGFSADRLLDLGKRASTRSDDSQRNNRDDDVYPNLRFRNTSSLDKQSLDAGDILTGDIDFGKIFKNGDIGDILGGAFTSQGRIGKMQINASNFSFDGVRYDGLNLSLGEIKFNWAKALRGEFDIQSVQPGNLGIALRADQAQRLIAPRLPSIREAKLRFENGLVYVGGKTDFYGLGVPFEAGGRLSVQTNQVRADDLKLSVSKLRRPSFVENELTKSVNPLYDFDPDQKWPFAVNLRTAAADNGVLALRGGLQWLGFNRSNRDSRNRDSRDRNSRTGSQKKQSDEDEDFLFGFPR